MNNMPIRQGACLFFLMVSSFSYAGDVEESVRCLGTEGKKAALLEFHDVGSSRHGWNAGFVKYGRKRAPVTLVPMKTDRTETVRGRPDEVTTVWKEVINGTVTGTYVVTTQGANIYGFNYTNLKTGATTDFQDMPERSNERGECQW